MPTAPRKPGHDQKTSPTPGFGLIGITGIGLAAVLVVGIIVVTAGFFVMESHPVSMSRLSHVSAGASTFEVGRLLGAPTRIESAPSGDRWIYSSLSKWCIVTVQFDSDGTVASIDHDH